MSINYQIILLSIFFCSNAHASDSLSRKEIISDLDYIHKHLQEFHPNLYNYSSPETLDGYFNEIKRTIPDSVSQEHAFELIAGVSQIIKDGHTIFLPSTASIEHNFMYDKFIPFDIYWDGEQMFVKKNYSQDTTIRAGTIINKIDGLSSWQVAQRINDILPRDGDNSAYANWIFNTYFSSYYNFVFGNVDMVELSIENTHYLVPALSRDEIDLIKEIRFPNNNDPKPLSLTIDTSLSIAIITIPDFHKTVIKSNDQNFKKLIRAYFSKIEVNNIENLILDFRDNQGGSLRNGRILLSYLLEDKFKLVDQYYRVRNRHNSNPNDRLRKSLRDFPMTYHPRRRSFNGKIFVIINGGSFSNTGMVSSCLDRNNRAIFVGQETGGSASILSSDPKYLTLPNSGISVQIPTLQYVLPEYPEGMIGGVKPDFYLIPTVTDIIQNKDIEYIEVKKQIENKFTTKPKNNPTDR